MAVQMLNGTPTFTVTLRGYDKDEVDDYLQTLRDRQGSEMEALEAADRTIRALENESRQYAERVEHLEACIKGENPRTIAALGERLTLILTEAEAGANETVAVARREAEAVREEATRAADRITRYATHQANEAERRAAATTRGAEQRAAQIEEQARQRAGEILDEAENQAESRIAEINRWVGRVRAQIKAEQVQAAEEFEALRERRQAELAQMAARRDELLGSLNAVCQTVADTITAHRDPNAPLPSPPKVAAPDAGAEDSAADEGPARRVVRIDDYADTDDEAVVDSATGTPGENGAHAAADVEDPEDTLD